MDCFGKPEVDKKRAMSQGEAWDYVEEERALTVEEIEA